MFRVIYILSINLSVGQFLVVCTRLNTALCSSVDWSVRLSVSPSNFYCFFCVFFFNFISLSHVRSFKPMISHSKSLTVILNVNFARDLKVLLGFT